MKQNNEKPGIPIKELNSPEKNDLEVKIEGVADENHRGEWGNHIEFVLSIIGFSVGFGNIWRFPYVCFDNGGGAFLIPYFIILFVIGKPLYFMELSLGQFTRRGPPGAFKIAPITMGIGYAMLFTCLIICVYYNILMAYTLYYTFASFQRHLPWAHCNNNFNTKFCYDTNTILNTTKTLSNSSMITSLNTSSNDGVNLLNHLNFTLQSLSNTSIFNYTDLNYQSSMHPNLTTPYVSNFNQTIGNDLAVIKRNVSSMEEFWINRVLGFNRSKGIDDIGPLKWDLALILFLSWLIVFGMLYKGIQTAGKAIYVTATLPYLLLIILLIRGVTLKGSGAGLKYLFTPQWDKLLEIKVWKAACSQMFFSLSLALGGITTFASFNPFRNNCYKDAVIVSIMDTVTSLIAGIVIFSYLGNMAYELDLDLTDGSQTISGPGLVFIVYPRALSRLPLPQLWSVLFFLMLYILGLDSEIALIQTITSAIHDQFPTIFPWKYKTYMSAGICFLCFLLGLPFVTYGGFYVFDLINYYVGDFNLIFIAAAEVVGIMWIYGFKRFVKDIEMMLGRTLPHKLYWLCGWVVFGPLLLITLTITSLYDLVTQDEHKLDNYKYPGWAHSFGWTLTIAILAQIVIGGLYYFWKEPGTFREKAKMIRSPSSDFWLKGCNYNDENFENVLKLKLGEKP